MTGLHYPDNLYADHEERKARRSQAPTGAYRSTDPVTKPAHYQRAGIETIDYIRATLSAPGFEAYCIGNVLKYVSRYREKGGVEDLRKAQVYLGWAIEPVKAGAKGSVVVHDPGVPPPGGWMRFQEADSDLIRDPKWSREWAEKNGVTTYNRAPNAAAPTTVERPTTSISVGGHPMHAETLRDHDERLAGGEDRL